MKYFQIHLLNNSNNSIIIINNNNNSNNKLRLFTYCNIGVEPLSRTFMGESTKEINMSDVSLSYLCTIQDTLRLLQITFMGTWMFLNPGPI